MYSDSYNIGLNYLKEKYGLNPIPDSEIDDRKIEILIQQYYYGIAAKKELAFLLESKGILKSNNNI